MQTRYGQSPWIATFPAGKRPDFPKLRGEHRVPVVILGAGLTGCATAHACAAAGLRPIVIETERVGQGATGRGAGLLLPEPGPLFTDIAGAHGLRVARQVFAAWRLAARDGAAQLRRLSIRCGLDAREGLTAAYADTETRLRREYDARHAAGLDAAWLSAKQVRGAAAFDAAGAMRVRGGFAIDPYRAAVGLAVAATKRGATFFERTRAKKVTFGRRGVDVVVDGGVVHADTVIVATGTATSEFHALRRHFKRRETYLALSEPAPAAMRKAIGGHDLTLGDLRASGRRTNWTSDGRLLVVGADQAETPSRRRQEVLVQRTGQLMYETLMTYPAMSGLKAEYGWDAAYGETADGLMYIGPHRNYPNHLFALGGSRVSVTGAFLAARLLVRAAQGAAEKADAAFGWTR